VSAAFPYEALRTEKVDPLIVRFGRDVTLTRAALPTTAAPPAGKPWVPTTRGDADTVDDAAAQSIGGLKAVFKSLIRTDRDGQTVEAKTQGVIIGAEAELPEQVGKDWKLVEAAADGGRVWEVVTSRPLKPGPTLMLYTLELAL
jgi:hypothetical protein